MYIHLSGVPVNIYISPGLAQFLDYKIRYFNSISYWNLKFHGTEMKDIQ